MFRDFVDWLNNKDLVNMWYASFIDKGTHDLFVQKREVVKMFFTIITVIVFSLGVFIGTKL